jgi:hypothetical protein
MAREAALAAELTRLAEALAGMARITGVRIGAARDEWSARQLG